LVARLCKEPHPAPQRFWLRGAIAEIGQIIRPFAGAGAGVMLISSYLPEIFDLSDLILVAKSGTIAAEFVRSEASAEKILHAAIH
jgi:simple sugar transport system ATP-binding protein